MKLYYSNTSPYSRKVRLVARVKGLESKIEEVLVNPFSEDKGELIAANPLGKIPTLALEDGIALFDSPVICEYLDALSDDSTLIPASQRLNILRWQATADGMTDAAYNLVMETRRPMDEQSATAKSNWSSEILRALDYIESGISELSSAKDITLAHLALASAISYLDFRLPEILYESECPQVSASPNTMTWYESFKTRPFMQATQLRDLVS